MGVLNRQWLVAELPVLRYCFRCGIADMAAPVAGMRRS
jgi:hypothetical protein